jgi:hypothetical protein
MAHIPQEKTQMLEFNAHNTCLTENDAILILSSHFDDNVNATLSYPSLLSCIKMIEPTTLCRRLFLLLYEFRVHSYCNFSHHIGFKDRANSKELAKNHMHSFQKSEIFNDNIFENRKKQKIDKKNHNVIDVGINNCYRRF